MRTSTAYTLRLGACLMVLAAPAEAADTISIPLAVSEPTASWAECSGDILAKAEQFTQKAALGDMNLGFKSWFTEKDRSCVADPMEPLAENNPNYYYVTYHLLSGGDTRVEPKGGYAETVYPRIVVLLERDANAAGNHSDTRFAPRQMFLWEGGWMYTPHFYNSGGRAFSVIEYGTGNKDGRDAAFALAKGIPELDVTSWAHDRIKKPKSYGSSRPTRVEYDTLSSTVVFNAHQDFDWNDGIIGETPVDLKWKGNRLTVKNSEYQVRK